jgi:hypothetical protein
MGLVQMAGGAATAFASGTAIVAGGALAPETLGGGLLLSAAGYAGWGFGADQASAGLQTLLTGQATRTVIGQGIEYATGASPQVSEFASGMLSLTPATAGAYVYTQGTRGLTSYNAASRATYTAAERPAQPLLLGYTPTTNTLSQIRNMRGPERWQSGEQYVQELYGSPGQQHFPVPPTTVDGQKITGSGGRFVDAPVPTSNGGTIANEVKTYQTWRSVNGQPMQQSVPLSDNIQQQILKDVWLRSNVPGYDPRWIFLDAAPSPELSRQLTNQQIIHIIHH